MNFRSHLFGLVRLGRGGVHVRSDTWSFVFSMPFWRKGNSISSDHFVFPHWSRRAWGDHFSFSLFCCFEPCSHLHLPINRGSFKQGFLQLMAWKMMLVRVPDQWTHGSTWIRLNSRILGQLTYQMKMGLRCPLQICVSTRLLWILSRSNRLHHHHRLQLRLQSLRPLGTWWTMWMSPLPLGASVVNKNLLRGKARKGLDLFNWVLTMPATSPCQPTFSKWALDKGNVLSWCWIIVINGCNPLFRGGCWMRSWRTPMPGSMFCRTLVWWGPRPRAITATFSWWRRSTILRWSWLDLWLHMGQSHAVAGILRQVKCFRMRLFSLSAGRSCGTTVLRGWTWRSRWKVNCWFTWSWGGTDRIQTCRYRSTMCLTRSCGSSRRLPSFPRSWWQCSKDGEFVPYPGKLVGGSTLSLKEEL